MNNVRPQLKLMNEEQVQEAHKNVLRVLSETGRARRLARDLAVARVEIRVEVSGPYHQIPASRCGRGDQVCTQDDRRI